MTGETQASTIDGRLPYYAPIADEVDIFMAAYRERLPVLLQGPTGCGKTRLVEHIAGLLASEHGSDVSLTTIACHEDLTSADLVGRYLLEPNGTRWIDGPLTRAVREGGICYLDEVVEARNDAIVLIHPLIDHRRSLLLERRVEMVEAHESFLLVASYNPGYQSRMKDLKPSTRQRFVSISFDYPPPEVEAMIVMHEAGCSPGLADFLSQTAHQIREASGDVAGSAPSTRLLINAARLVNAEIATKDAIEAAIILGVSDDHITQDAMRDLVLSLGIPGHFDED